MILFDVSGFKFFVVVESNKQSSTLGSFYCPNPPEHGNLPPAAQTLPPPPSNRADLASDAPGQPQLRVH